MFILISNEHLQNSYYEQDSVGAKSKGKLLTKNILQLSRFEPLWHLQHLRKCGGRGRNIDRKGRRVT